MVADFSPVPASWDSVRSIVTFAAPSLLCILCTEATWADLGWLVVLPSSGDKSAPWLPMLAVLEHLWLWVLDILDSWGKAWLCGKLVCLCLKTLTCVSHACGIFSTLRLVWAVGIKLFMLHAVWVEQPLAQVFSSNSFSSNLRFLWACMRLSRGVNGWVAWSLQLWAALAHKEPIDSDDLQCTIKKILLSFQPIMYEHIENYSTNWQPAPLLCTSVVFLRAVNQACLLHLKLYGRLVTDQLILEGELKWVSQTSAALNHDYYAPFKGSAIHCQALHCQNSVCDLLNNC